MAVNSVQVAVSDASSGHLRRCRDTDTSIKCLSSEAVDCDIHNVRYDMVDEGAGCQQSQIGPHQVTYDA
eukprot:scaffold42345_cov460-Skeletonema_marinoi.AAC.1